MADTYYMKDNPSAYDISSDVREIDKELEELLKKQTAKIKVVGVGGGGGNSLSRMREIGIKGGELIAINTDAQDLLYASADQKILIGKELTQGLGAGSNPKVGEEAAKESESEIKKKIAGGDMIFITCGLGGGTGTGAAPIVANLAKKQGALTIGVVTLPFTIEGKKRLENAMNGLDTLDKIKVRNPDIAVVMLSQQDKIDVAVNCMHHRAFDYVVKSETAFIRLQKIVTTIFSYKKMEKELNWYMERM